MALLCGAQAGAAPRARVAAKAEAPAPLALRMDTALASLAPTPGPAIDPLLLSGPHGPIQARTLSLLQAIRQAEAGATALARGEQSVAKAEAGVLGAGNAFLPQIDLSAQVLRYGNKNKQATLVGSTVVESETAFYGSYAALTASINLYAGGRNSAGYRAASAELEAARADFENLRTRQFAQVIEQYTTLIKAQEEYLSLNTQVALYEDRELQVAAAFRRGRASRLDINEARLQLGRQRQLAMQQLAALENRAGQLAVSLGLEIPGDERLVALERLPEPPALPDGPAPADLERKLAGHPALRAGERRVESARNKLVAARAQYRPRLDLVGSYNWVGQDDGSAADAIGATRTSSYTVGLTLQQSLTPFTQKNPALQVAQAELYEAEAEARETRLGLLQAARQALAEVVQARAALTIARQAEADADDVLSLQRARLRHGRGSERDLVQARADLAQRSLERAFQDNNYRLTGWTAYALLEPGRFAAALLERLR